MPATSNTSNRAQDVAFILWELKQADKLATLTSIAHRAGFEPGRSQNTISNCLKNVRRDWPHLEWWRAVADNGQLQREQAFYLDRGGFVTTAVGEDHATINAFDAQLIEWSAASPAPSIGSA